MAEQATDLGSTRERLLDAAATVIARDGFQGARLADVAREAGLTTGAIYSNFRDKEELFLAAFDRVQGLGQAVAAAEATDIESRLKTAPQEIRRFAESSQRQILNLELALLGTRDPKVHKLLRKAMRETIKNLAEQLPGEPSDAYQRATLLVALENGLALMRMLAGDDVPLEGLPEALRKLAGLGDK